MSNDSKYPIGLSVPLWDGVITTVESRRLEFPSPPDWSGARTYTYEVAPGIIPLTEGVVE